MSSRLTFVCGTDDFLVSRTGKQIWEKLCQQISDPYSCEIIDGAAGTIPEVEEAINRFNSAVQTLSMFGDSKAVWLRNISFLADSVTGRSETTKEQVERLLQVLGSLDPANVKVLLTATPVDRRRKSFKELQSLSDFQFIDDSKDEGALISVISAEAEQLGVKLAPGAGAVLLAKINGHTRLALEEIRKLATYLGAEGGVIDENLVAELVPNFGEGDFFETVEAFYSLDLSWTLDAIRRHFFAGYDGRPMITSLQNRNRLLIQLKVLSKTGLMGSRPSAAGLQKAAARFGDPFAGITAKTNFNVFSQNPWYLGRLSQNLDKLSIKKLIDFQATFLGAFTGILERPNDQESVMKEVAVRCLG